MWGTSSPGDNLTGDFGNEPDATSISDRGLFRLLAGDLSPGVFRLLQHNLPGADSCTAAKYRASIEHCVDAQQSLGRADVGLWGPALTATPARAKSTRLPTILPCLMRSSITSDARRGAAVRARNGGKLLRVAPVLAAG